MAERKCPSFCGYSITNDGQVFTHRKRFGLGKGKGGGVRVDPSYSRELSSYIGHGGYPYFSISTKKGQRAMPLHVLLLDAFVGPRPDGMECRHLDGNPLNNSLKNLCYGTAQQNSNDRIAHGKSCAGQLHHRAKLTTSQVYEIRDRYAEHETIASIARLFSVGESTIRDIVKRRNWKHLPERLE